MNSKTTAGVILLQVFSIVFNSSFKFVDSALANADLEKATTCLRQFFGDYYLLDKNDPSTDEEYREDKNHPSSDEKYREDEPLTDGEYVGNISSDFLNKTISKKTGGKYDGAEIRQCLIRVNGVNVFEKYSEANPSAQNSQSLESKLLHQIKSELELSNLNLPPEVRVLLQRVPSLKPNTPIYKFIKGVCKFEEFTEFGELIDENDKTETLKCLEECSGKFVLRLAKVVYSAKTKTIESLTHKLEEKKKELLIPMKDIREENVANFLENRENTKQKYKDQIDNLNSLEYKSPEDYSKRLQTLQNPSDIDLMTILGTKYLYNYGEIYNSLDQVLTEEDKQLNNIAGNLDKNLSYAFFLYEACTVRGCGMKPSTSSSLYKIIEYHAKDPAPNPPLLSLGAMKAFVVQKFGYVSKPPYTKFFKALWAGGKYAKDAI